jgi:hypothetical protein
MRICQCGSREPNHAGTIGGEAALGRRARKDGMGIDLALQLLYLKASESMGNHDSKVVDADSVD